MRRSSKIVVIQYLIIILLINNLLLKFSYANSNILEVQGLTIWQSIDNVKLVFNLSNKINYQIYTLSNPNRLVIDFNYAKLAQSLLKDFKKSNNLNFVVNIRSGSHPHKSRVVLDLNRQILFNSFLLKPNKRYDYYRLVLDIKKTFLIAIDPGHGGEDPGAIGPRGTREKAVTLAIAKKLNQLINTNTNKQAILLRTGDYYLSLRDRVQKARKAHADLLISIHADAFIDKKADGGSVFILSERGATSSIAKWLADAENRADAIGGISLNNKNKEVASVLLNLSHTANSQASLQAAKSILISMDKEQVLLHKDTVEMANFAVLKAPDVPSVLVESGFISNPKTELKLKNNAYQRKVAESILLGIEKYCGSK